MKGRNGKIIAIVAALVVVLAVVLLLVFHPWSGYDDNNLVNEGQPADPNAALQAREEFPGVELKPTNIKIDKIGVNIGITPAGKDAQNRFEAPVGADGVTWYENGTSPGWSGNALLTGHNYINSTPGTFEKLHTLKVDDIIEITYEGGYIGKFSVRSVTSYHEQDEAEQIKTLMKLEGETKTTIITCGGTRKTGGGYTHRTFVILDAVEYTDPEGVPVPEAQETQPGVDPEA